MSKEILYCPYCDREFEFEYDPTDDKQDVKDFGVLQCEYCEKNFKIEFKIEYIQNGFTSKLPCANGEPHKFIDYNNYGLYEKYEICSYCLKTNVVLKKQS